MNRQIPALSTVFLLALSAPKAEAHQVVSSVKQPVTPGKSHHIVDVSGMAPERTVWDHLGDRRRKGKGERSMLSRKNLF